MKKVVILCPYSYPSACGVWMRVLSDGKALLNSGYEVHVFSSNIIKGTKEKSSKYELYEGIRLHRFRVWFSLGGNARFWFFSRTLGKVNPDIIHTHVYRHPHSFQALILGKMLGKKVLLTTHAPFEKDPKRSIFMKLFDIFYDIFIGWWELRLYNKIIRISDWEKAYLSRRGIKDEKSVLISNGINEKFLNENELSFLKKAGLPSHLGDLPIIHDCRPSHKILYMGRLDPVKRLEWVSYAADRLPEYKFKIEGPLSGYDEFKSQSPNLDIVIKTYKPDEFVEELKSTDIYVLPSAREALSITTLEAMAMGVISIVSNAKGPSDFVKDGINGFIVGSQEELVDRIKFVYANWEEVCKMKKKARETAQKYSERNTTQELINLYSQLLT